MINGHRAGMPRAQQPHSRSLALARSYRGAREAFRSRADQGRLPAGGESYTERRAIRGGTADAASAQTCGHDQDQVDLTSVSHEVPIVVFMITISQGYGRHMHGCVRVRDRLIEDYREFTGSFVEIHDPRIAEHVAERMERGYQWPTLAVADPTFASGGTITELVATACCSPSASGSSGSRRRPGRACPSFASASA